MKGSLQTKNGIYQAVFYYKDERNPKGKTIWRSTGIPAKRGNKKKAEQRLQEIKTQLEQELTNPQPTKTLFADYVKRWLKSVETQVDLITFVSYKQHAEKHILPYFEPFSLELQKVAVTDIEGYYKYKSGGGRLDGKKGGLSRDSIKRHGVVLSLIFDMAIRENFIKINPCEKAKIPKQAETQSKKPEFYNVVQCEDLLKATKETILYDMIYITFLYGLRRSEMMGLRWHDIDFERNTVTIRHTVVANGIVVEKEKTKTKSSNRIYPLLDDVKKVLLHRKAVQEHYKSVFGNCYHKSDYVFTKENGNTFYPDYASKALQKVLKRNDLPHIRWHDLRHSCASMLLDRGWHMKDISDWLGHADIGTTMNLYAHLDLEHKRKMSDDLNGLFR